MLALQFLDEQGYFRHFPQDFLYRTFKGILARFNFTQMLRKLGKILLLHCPGLFRNMESQQHFSGIVGRGGYRISHDLLNAVRLLAPLEPPASLRSEEHTSE